MSDQTQAESPDTSGSDGGDEPPGDEAEGGASSAPAEGEQKAPESEEAAKPEGPDRRGLEALEEDIQKVRADAEDLIVGPDDTPAQRYSESGEEGRDEDDQTITPPG